MDLPQHVLRFWETRFPQIKPLKRGGGRRYYRPDDVVLLAVIKRLLYDQGYTIKGVQRMLREKGVSAVVHGVPRAEPDLQPADHPLQVHDEEEPEASPAATFNSGAVAALRDALADIREAERHLRQAQASGATSF